MIHHFSCMSQGSFLLLASSSNLCTPPTLMFFKNPLYKQSLSMATDEKLYDHSFTNLLVLLLLSTLQWHKVESVRSFFILRACQVFLYSPSTSKTSTLPDAKDCNGTYLSESKSYNLFHFYLPKFIFSIACIKISSISAWKRLNITLDEIIFSAPKTYLFLNLELSLHETTLSKSISYEYP